MSNDRPSTTGARAARCRVVFAALIAALLLVSALSVSIGTVRIPLGDVLRTLLGTGTAGANDRSISWSLRMPRVLLAAILGGALALSGFLLQSFFGNPIAGPFVLGISSGAKLVVAVTLVIATPRLGGVSSGALIAAAFLGSLMSVGFILLLSRRLRHMAVLLVGGIMIGYICSAITDFIVTFAQEADIANLHGWSLGSFSGSSWSGLMFAGVLVGIAALLVFLLSKPIGAYQLGEE